MDRLFHTLQPLSKQARSLWAKSDYEEGAAWLPLFVHMADTCFIAEKLWDEWLPPSTRNSIAFAFDSRLDIARKTVCFLAAVHDIGKATPVFQARPIRFAIGETPENLAWKAKKAGLPILGDLAERRSPSHPVAGQVILEKYLVENGWSLPESRKLSSIVGAHHGRPPQRRDVRAARKDREIEMGWMAQYGDGWKSVQVELIGFARMLAGLDEDALATVENATVAVPVESLLCGIVIMADWIASNSELCPLVPLVGEMRRYQTTEGGDADLPRRLKNRADGAWERLSLMRNWHVDAGDTREYIALFSKRFGLQDGAVPYPVQKAAIELSSSMEHPGIIVIEAPMGEGKTEAALAAAEILAARFGSGGVCVALPTMATTDAMFGRVHGWIERLPAGRNDRDKSIYLAHGKAQLNEEYQGLISSSRAGWSSANQLRLRDEGASDVAEVSDWMFGRKKGMLANFVVCTVDQVLMGALEMKHLPLRQLALANKVVIIDECHAYDAYMRNYLVRVLEWMGFWHAPVILLSATLPRAIRDDLVLSYQTGWKSSFDAGRGCGRINGEKPTPMNREVSTIKSGNRELCSPEGLRYPYPLITIADGDLIESYEINASGRLTTVEMSNVHDDDAAVADLLSDRLSDGGCAGIVCDTVTRAQRMASALSERFGREQVILVHSRFIDLDRMNNERLLRDKLGPRSTLRNGMRPERLIVVGTQVLEQSLDVDFDVMVSDIAPIDLILQRVGRLHRHRRGERECERPVKLRKAQCYVRGVVSFEDGPRFATGVDNVYDRATLMEALAVLELTQEGACSCLSLPSDIAPLVQTAYGERVVDAIPNHWGVLYGEAVEKRRGLVEKKNERAQGCLLESAASLQNDGRTLENLFGACVDDSESKLGSDKGQCAVRDTQETIEVMLAERLGNEIRLLPWVGNSKQGVELGRRIPVEYVPDDEVAMLLAQSSVRLPIQMCRYEDIDDLIEDLEEQCGPWAGAWQESYWLAGRLALILEQEEGGYLSATVHGWKVIYSQRNGLVIPKLPLPNQL